MKQFHILENMCFAWLVPVLLLAARPAGGAVTVDANLPAGNVVVEGISGDTVRLNGRGNVYALSQESGTGVIVDNIPMRGCLGNVFTKMDSAQLASFYRSQNVRLIIMQFGGNAIPFNKNFFILILKKLNP